MPLKKRSAPTANLSLISQWWLEDAIEDGSSLLSGNMPLEAAPTATINFDSMCRHEDGLADGASGDKPTVHSSCRRRVGSGSGSFTCQERLLRVKQDNDPMYLPIVALVDEMICVKKDHDRAETKGLCSKLSAIIQNMKDDTDVPRSAKKDKVGLVPSDLHVPASNNVHLVEEK